MAEVCVEQHYRRGRIYFGGKWEKANRKVGGKVARGRKSQSKITSVIHVKIILWEAHNFIGGKWEEVEWEERNRILFWGGRNIGGKWEEVACRGGPINFGNPWDVNVLEGRCLRKFSAEGVEAVQVIPGNPWG